MALTSDPTGFDYWNILVGQGDYYNPIFIDNGEKRQIEGYATNITTDLALDWLDNKRDKSKPFCLLLHHKAPHRTWMPDTCDLRLYDDVTSRCRELLRRLRRPHRRLGAGDEHHQGYGYRIRLENGR